jgi:hypothetical protein
MKYWTPEMKLGMPRMKHLGLVSAHFAREISEFAPTHFYCKHRLILLDDHNDGRRRSGQDNFSLALQRPDPLGFRLLLPSHKQQAGQ